jgi:lysozyme
MRTLSDNGIAKLKALEGFKAKPYADSAGKKTVGYGHVVVSGDGVALGDIISPVKGTELLETDIKKAVASVNGCVTKDITQNQFDALVIFAYNVGVSAFQGSTLLKKVNSNDLEGASLEFLKWDKVHTAQGMFIELPGLKNRRLAEQELFLTKPTEA